MGPTSPTVAVELTLAAAAAAATAEPATAGPIDGAAALPPAATDTSLISDAYVLTLGLSAPGGRVEFGRSQVVRELLLLREEVTCHSGAGQRGRHGPTVARRDTQRVRLTGMVGASCE